MSDIDVPERRDEVEWAFLSYRRRTPSPRATMIGGLASHDLRIHHRCHGARIVGVEKIAVLSFRAGLRSVGTGAAIRRHFASRALAGDLAIGLLGGAGQLVENLEDQHTFTRRQRFQQMGVAVAGVTQHALVPAPTLGSELKERAPAPAGPADARNQAALRQRLDRAAELSLVLIQGAGEIGERGGTQARTAPSARHSPRFIWKRPEICACALRSLTVVSNARRNPSRSRMSRGRLSISRRTSPLHARN